MSSFTPGPWESETEYECAVYAHNHQMKIADIRGWGYLTGKGQGGLGLSSAEASKIQNANARLIAAAPEMLEVIHDLLEPAYERYQYVLETDTPDEAEVYKETIDQTEALLRRIEGEETP